MKAVTRTIYGSPEVLNISETSVPRIQENELLIKVYATTVNRTDCANLTGKPYIVRLFTGLLSPKKAIPGTDFSGEVVETGSKVTAYKTGDRIFGFDDHGLSSMAETMKISSENGISHIPSGVSYSEAAASVEGVHYAINFLNKVDLKKGQKAMVNGGTGAIGSSLIQLLKYYGLKVVATGPAEHLSTLMKLGAERAIDYRAKDFTRDREKFHYVFDSVGKSTFGNCKPLLYEDGTYISSELGPNWENPFLAITTSFSKGKKVKFPFPKDIKASLKFIANLLEIGRFKPLIDRRYPLEQARAAFEYVSSGQKIGNVILEIRPDEGKSL